jgi:hypothetical protein
MNAAIAKMYYAGKQVDQYQPEAQASGPRLRFGLVCGSFVPATARRLWRRAIAGTTQRQ